MNSVEAYPLCWPHGRPRTRQPQRARFDTKFGIARDSLVGEIGRLGGRDIIISTNIPLRRDGLPYASRKMPDDTGVAVYFLYRGEQHCFACDKWDSVADNIQAIRKTIEALRGVARWGTGDMMERAFTGFSALPGSASESDPWWGILDVDPESDFMTVKRAYQRRRADTHPDRGGDAQEFDRVQRAWVEFQESRP